MKTKKDFEKLILNYPNLFKGQPRSGFYVGGGWYDLIDNLCSTLEHHVKSLPEELKVDIYVVQVKEKFGLLRVYFNQETPFMSGAIAVVESLSGIICEDCGKTGKLRGGSYIRTLCDKCDKRKIK